MALYQRVTELSEIELVMTYYNEHGVAPEGYVVDPGTETPVYRLLYGPSIPTGWPFPPEAYVEATPRERAQVLEHYERYGRPLAGFAVNTDWPELVRKYGTAVPDAVWSPGLGYLEDQIDLVSGGLPTGGTEGQILTMGASDYVWSDPVPVPVTSVNGQIGAVALSAGDVGASPATHAHPISDVTGLQTALDMRSAVGHTHESAEITDLAAAIDAHATVLNHESRLDAAEPTIATHTTAIARVDPGTAGADGNTVRIVNGVPVWRGRAVFFAKDYLSGNPADDASPGMAALIAAASAPAYSSGLYGADIVFEPGEYRLTVTADFLRFTGRVIGSGQGTSPFHASVPGNGTVFRWDGLDNEPMFRIQDSRLVTFENFRMEGKDLAPPSYAFQFHKETTHGNGVNSMLTVRNVWLGTWAWSTQGLNAGLIRRGIGMTGSNVDNDRLFVDQVFMKQVTEYGLYIPNNQSVSGSIRDSTIQGKSGGPYPVGIATGAGLRIDNVVLQYCSPDLETLVSGTIVSAHRIHSEHSQLFARLYHNCNVSIRESLIQVGGIIAGGGVMIDAFPAELLTLTMENVEVTGNTNPANARIEIGPSSTDSKVGRISLRVVGCRDMSDAQLVLPAGSTFWASSPMSQMTVEWDTWHGNTHYQFRNELTPASGLGRQAIDTTAWDMPISGSASRKVTASGVLRLRPQAAPASGVIGDMYMTTGGVLKVCTVAGTPGTWVSVGAQT